MTSDDAALAAPQDAVAAWSEARFRETVDALRRDPARLATTLPGLLDERHPAYTGRGTAAVVRMRAHALLALAVGPSPWPQALPFALEELESGRDPLLIAVAARVLPRLAQPSAAWAPFVLSAIRTLRQQDDAVDLTRYGGVPVGVDLPSTAMDEVLRCLRWLGPAAAGASAALAALADEPGGLAEDHRRTLHQLADTLIQPPTAGPARADAEEDGCCPGWLPQRPADLPRPSPAALDEVRFEDQDGRSLAWADFFQGRPSVLVFFYTRCDNAMKCSLSVSRLAQLQSRLRQAPWGARVRTAAVTYDAAFDLPHRLRGYAESRGMVLDEAHRVLRVTTGGETLRAGLALGVSFVASLVNRHRIEAFVLDAQGRVQLACRRMRWDVPDLMAALERLATEAEEAAPATGPQAPSPTPAENPSPRTVRAASGLSPLWMLALALFPKCPLCGAGYLSLAGLAALPHLGGWYWTWPLLALALLTNLGVLAWQLRRHGQRRGLLLSVAGAAVLLDPGVAGDSTAALALGFLLSLAGALDSTRAWSVAARARRAHGPLPS